MFPLEMIYFHVEFSWIPVSVSWRIDENAKGRKNENAKGRKNRNEKIIKKLNGDKKGMIIFNPKK